MAIVRRYICACVLASACVLGVGWPGTAQASPPLASSGLDLPILLSMWDRARRASYRLEHRWQQWWTEHASSSDERPPDAPTPSSLDSIQTIVLDPGHGGDNGGGFGVAKVKEKHLTLELAYLLRRRLQRRYPDLRVVMTRYWDTSLPLHERTHMANRVDADLLLSLHYNAAPHNRAVGLETYFLPTHKVVPGREKVDEGQPIATTASKLTGVPRQREREEVGIQKNKLAVIRRDLARARDHKYSGRLAQIVQTHLVDSVDTVDRGVKQRNFEILRGAMMPAVIVEAGFLTHPEEGREVLNDRHRARVVSGLLEAVERFDRLRSRARPSSESTADQADSTGQ